MPVIPRFSWIHAPSYFQQMSAFSEFPRASGSHSRGFPPIRSLAEHWVRVGRALTLSPFGVVGWLMAFRFIHTADVHLDSPLRTLALKDARYLRAHHRSLH